MASKASLRAIALLLGLVCAILMVILLTAPQSRAMTAPERVSVLGNSWCSGLEWADPSVRADLDLHCLNGSTTRTWNADRVRKLELERIVYLQLGGNDRLNWIVKGKKPKSQWAPRRVASRLRKLIKLLERRGHEVYVLGYNAPHLEELGAAAMQQRQYCRDPRGKLGPDGIHLTPESYAHRAHWLVIWRGCHSE